MSEAGVPSGTQVTRRRVGTLLRLVVSVGALAFLFRQVELGALPGVLAEAGIGSLCVALAAYLGSQVVSALRWMLVARSAGFDLTARLAIRYYFIGMFFNVLGPSTLGSDVARTLYLARDGRGAMTAAATVLYDRYIGFVWLTIIVAVALALLGADALPSFARWATLFLVGGLVAISCVGIALARRLTLGGASGAPMLRLLDDGTMLLRTSGLSLVVQASQIGATVVLARALTPQVHWSYCFVFQPLVAMLGALPISVAGLGVRESGYVYFLATLGRAPVESATAFALAWLAILVASSLAGGAVFLFSGESPPSRSNRRQACSTNDQFPPSS